MNGKKKKKKRIKFIQKRLLTAFLFFSVSTSVSFSFSAFFTFRLHEKVLAPFTEILCLLPIVSSADLAQYAH